MLKNFDDCGCDIFPNLTKKDIVDVVCPKCGETRSTFVNNIRRAKHHYCSDCRRSNYHSRKNAEKNSDDCGCDLFPNLTKRDRVDVVCPRCGETRNVLVQSIRDSKHHYCSGCSQIMRNESKAVVGQVFGRLTVTAIDVVVVESEDKRRQFPYCTCRCSCGNIVTVRRSSLLTGDTVSCGCYGHERRHRVGKEAFSYNPNLTEEQRSTTYFQRRNNMCGLWRKAVNKLYNKTCIVCGSQEKIEVHHIESFAQNEALRFDIANGVCLCKTCHKAYHISFMKGYRNPATRESFNDFLVAMKAL